MILLEGVDRTGKTTVAEHLMRLLPGWSFVHQTKPDCHPFKYGMQRVANSHPRVVLDRLHWSNYAYGRVYDGSQDLLSGHEWRLTELALASRGTVIVYMHDDLENILGRWGKGEMYAPTELPQLLGHYRNLVGGAGEQKSCLPVHVAKMTDLVDGECQPTRRLHLLAAECESFAQAAASLPPPSQGIGKPNPGFVVVGEAPPDRCDPCGDLPRFPLDIGPAAGWLWRALDEMDTHWWDGYYTNATSFRDPAHFAAMMNLMGPTVVLALGEKARDLVRLSKIAGLRGDIRFAAVEHPMFVRRWRHRDFAPWKLAIGEALADYCNPEYDDGFMADWAPVLEESVVNGPAK